MIELTNEGDERLLGEIRRTQQGATVQQLSESIGVTQTAVRQRLNRLMGLGLVDREELRRGRGRPSYRYMLTDRAERLFSTNYGDLAVAMWREVKQIKDPATRRDVSRRVCDALVEQYGSRVRGETLEQRLEGLKDVLSERGIEAEVDRRGPLPILREHDCPYPSLAEADRSICALEKQVFARVLQSGVKLSRCRLDGHDCCEFETRRPRAKVAAS